MVTPLSPVAKAGFNPVQVSHGRVLALALPTTLAHVSTPLLGVADAAVIGRLGEAHLLGAIAAAALVFDFLFWSFGFLRQGTSGLTAQALGADDRLQQNATLVRALACAIGIGVLLILLQTLIAWIAFGLLAASPEVTRAARDYFDIRIWSAPCVLVNYAVLGALTGRGRTDFALALQVFINLLNIALNVGLVYGLSLGVRGSATGTLVAELAGTILGLLIVLRAYGDLFAVPRKLVLDRGELARMFGVNRDIMIRNAALLMAFAVFTAQGTRGGDIKLAANAILLNLFLVSAYFLDGFATAAAQMCGQSLGARDAKGFRKAFRLTLIWSLAFAAGVAAVAFVGGNLFIDFLTTNPEVRAYARDYLVFAASSPLLGALAFQLDGVFIGATWTRDMRNMMLLSLAIYCATAYGLQPLGNTGLWIAMLVFFVSRGLSLAWRYKTLSVARFTPQS
jgi:MATE family multidrug resistance protein